jgi:hypothetical protein
MGQLPTSTHPLSVFDLCLQLFPCPDMLAVDTAPCPLAVVEATYLKSFFFLVGLGFELKAGDLPLGPHLPFILLWLFWRWGLENCFPRLASNRDPPNLSLPSS